MTSFLVVLCAVFVAVNAGGIAAPGYLGYSGHVASSPIVSAYSSHGISAHAAPVVSAVHAAPIISAHAAPVINTHSAPIVSAYSTPVVSAHAGSGVATSYSSFSSHIGTPLAYSAPIAKTIVSAPVSYSVPALTSTHENTYRSFDGTVSQHSKGIDTPFSSVRKYDSRISNNVYSPAIATKTVAYAAPVAATYAAHAPIATSYAHSPIATSYAHAPIHTAYAAPAYGHASYSGLGLSAKHYL